MKVYICGHEGNMGKRYRAILEYMGHEWSGHDPKGSPKKLFPPSDADRILICSPTEHHVQDIRDLLKYKKPLLCEKPICKDRHELGDLLSDVQASGVKLQMINQYDFLNYSRFSHSPTEYNYFKSGGDGLMWDCINVLGSANGEVVLNNTSPIWRCRINGDDLNIKEMDVAYMDNISNFLNLPMDGTEYIWFAHERVLSSLEKQGNDKSSYRNPSEER